MKLNLKALMWAAGLMWGGTVLMVGVTNLIWPAYGSTFLQLVASIYPGYDVARSIGAVIVATVYALIDGAIFGLVFGWLYNFFLGKGSPA